MVDEVTANRFIRTSRMQAGWARWVNPGMGLAAAGILLLAVVDAVRGEQRLLPLAVLLALILAAVSSGGRLVLLALRSRHHPKLEDGGVLIRAVDGEAARRWADSNPRGGIEILA